MGVLTATYLLGAAAAGTATFIVVAFVANIAIGLVIGALTKSLTKKPTSSSLSASLADRMSTVRSPISAWRVVFGEVRVSGTLTFLHSFVSAPTGVVEYSHRHMVLTIAGHEVEEIGDIYFNDELVETVEIDGVVYGIGKFTGQVLLQKNLGSDSQAAFSQAMALLPTLWTANHRQRGRAGIYVVTGVDSNIFPGGLPNVTATVKGYNQVYDPRTAGSPQAGSTGYSNNPALCIAAYLCNTTFGYGVDYATGIDETALITAANVCDERVDAVWQPTFTTSAFSQTITLSAANNQISTGEGVKLTTTGALSVPLVVGTVYYLITTGATTAKLATTYDNALAGTAITMSGAGTGVHTLERCAIFLANATEDWLVFNQSNKKIFTGDGVRLATATTLPAPLAINTTYYAIRLDDDTIQLATTYANALAGTAIDITDEGAGIHTARLYDTVRYACNGTFLTSEEPLEIIQKLCSSMAGHAVKVGKTWRIVAGAYVAPEGSAYLNLPGSAGNYASTPDSVANSITGDIDIRVKAALTDWTPAATHNLIGKWNTTDNRSFLIIVGTTGVLTFQYSTDGLGGTVASRNSTAATGFTDGTTHWIRITVDVNDGAGNHVVKFYTSDDGVTWTQLGNTVTTAGTITLFDGAATLRISGQTGGVEGPIAGKVYNAQIYNGIDGTLAVDFNAEDADNDALSFASVETGEAWTVNQSGASHAVLVNTVATLSLSELRGPIDIQPLASWRETVNGVKGVFVSPENHWQPADFPPIVGATYLAEDGDKRAWRDLELPFTTRTLMAMRIAKIELLRARVPMRMTLPCRLSAYRFQPLYTFKVRWNRYGFNSQVFEVLNGKFTTVPGEDGAPALCYDLIVQQTAESIFDWEASEGAELRLPPPTDFPTIERLRELVPRNVGGLEIFEQGLDDEFVGKHCKFAWRRQSLFAPEVGGEAFGAGTEVFDMLEPVYLIRILTTLDGNVVAPIPRREEPLQKDTTYTYTYEKNVEDGDGTPSREFLMTVRQITKYGQRSPIPAYLNVTNPAPEVTDFAVVAIDRGFSFTYSCDDTDFDHIAVYVSLESGFTPSAANLVYQGIKRQGSVGPLLGGRRYYYKTIPSDVFGPGDTSDEASVVTYNNFAEQAVSNWTLRTTPNAIWNALDWSPALNIFAAVGNQVAMSSTDAIVWTTRTAAAALDWVDVAWSPTLGMFAATASVIGGSTGAIMTSTDGTSWTQQTTPNFRGRAIVWADALGLFVAVGGSGSTYNVITSPDGINWTGQTGIAGQWDSLAWSEDLGLLVAIGSVGSGNMPIMTSPDGVNWTSATDGAMWAAQGIAWSPTVSLFVAVGGATTPVATSPDGTTWTLRSAHAFPWFDVIWVQEFGLFVAVAYDGAGESKIMYSPDGINWTIVSSPGFLSWVNVAWSPELGVLAAVSSSGTTLQVMTSQFYKE